MMKRNILAVVVPALLVASAANAAEVYNKDGNILDLYGLVDARHQFSSAAGNNGDKTYARFGFKGQTKINDDITGYGQWEYNIQANHTEGQETTGDATRLAFAGLKFNQFGSFDYGRNYGLLYDVGSYTDVLPVFGDDTFNQTDTFLTGRANGVATYRNSDFFGLVKGWNFALQYQGKNDAKQSGDSGRSVPNGDGVAVSTSYNIGYGVSAVAAFSSSNRTVEQKTDGEGNKAQATAFGLKYDANNIYLATIYSDTRNMTTYGDSDYANQTQNFEAVAQYQFDFGLKPSIAYLQSRGKNLPSNGTFTGGSADLVKYLDLASYYSFNKNMTAYVDYKINLLKSDNAFVKSTGLATDNIVGVGMVYQF
jgi:outer membrane pore protein F